MTRPEFHALRRGEVLPPFSLCVSGEEVREYIEATGGDPAVWCHTVPPLALAALTLAGLMDQVPLPPGAVHVAQELESVAAVRHDETVEAQLSIAQQSVRQGTNVVVFALEVRREGRTVLRGRSTVMAPSPTATTTDAER
jgi:hypothetical protein